MEQAGEGGARRAGPGDPRGPGVRPTKTTLLRQGQAGIAIQHMKMALFDEGGVGGGQDIEIIDAGEGKALDGSPVSLAVAGAVVINDRFSRQAGADADRRVSGFCAQGFSQGTGASELASSGVHAGGELGNVAGQKHGRDAEEGNLRRPVGRAYATNGGRRSEARE